MEHLLWVVIFILVVSFVSNVSPFFGASYTLLATLQLTLLGFTPFNFAAVVIISAIGATLAKVVIYFGAFGFRGFLIKNKNIRLIGRSSSSPKFYAVLFVTALMPVLPLDDFIYIGAGATSSSIGLMASVTLAAKILKSGFEVALEYAILRDLQSAFNFQRLDITIVLIGAFLIIGIMIYRVDWEATYRYVLRKPPLEAGAARASGA